MQAGQKIFMTVVEEMSISRAAARSFVTQQCVSDHIKRLEEEYQVELFKRRPRLSITPAGQELYETFCEIKRVEEKLEKNLDRIKGQTKQKLTIGVNGTRINMILSKLLTEYNRYFPKVVISFVVRDTRTLEQMLLKEELDMLLDLNAYGSPQFNILSVAKDQLYFLISKKLFKKYYKNEDIKRFNQGIALKDFKDVPLVSNAEITTIHGILMHYAQKENVDLNILYYTGDYETQLALCSSNLAAGVCPTIVIKRILAYNKRNSDNELRVFPLKDQTEELEIQIVTNKGARQPEYMKKFIELLQILLQKEYS
ncbi:LysR family transcriptional regulator [Fusobacterium sp.]|uniref:LysR family transcriptional regulator n=1 Tax=Fusobacterium sp. TaxID=68766 RepID=UPI00396C5AA3